jgi:protein tyrosine phosphatase (PTP) superfamily phosphohydrolase (DUF442 family)
VSRILHIQPNTRTVIVRVLVAQLIGAGLIAGCASAPPPPPPVVTTTQPVTLSGKVIGIGNFARISENLYRGGQPSERGFQTLKQMGIRTVVDLRGQIHQESVGLRLIHIPSSASHPDERQIIEFLKLVRDPQACPVFVHGEQGTSRTGLYVAVYRMVEQGWSARDAEVELRNFGFDSFWKQIPNFLEHLDVAKLRDKISRSSSGSSQPAPSKTGGPAEEPVRAR